jgi:hypothetical protein
VNAIMKHVEQDENIPLDSGVEALEAWLERKKPQIKSAQRLLAGVARIEDAIRALKGQDPGPQVVSIDDAQSDRLADLLPIILKGGRSLTGKEIAAEALRLGYRRSDQAQVRATENPDERRHKEKELLRFAAIGIGRHATHAKGNAGKPLIVREQGNKFRMATSVEIEECLERRHHKGKPR